MNKVFFSFYNVKLILEGWQRFGGGGQFKISVIVGALVNWNRLKNRPYGNWPPTGIYSRSNDF